MAALWFVGGVYEIHLGCVLRHGLHYAALRMVREAIDGAPPAVLAATAEKKAKGEGGEGENLVVMREDSVSAFQPSEH